MTRQFRIARLLGSALMAASAIPAAAAEKPAAATSYAPGLGDFMTAYVQPHHIKLWWAGSAGNWPLAAYEADELGETFDDIVAIHGTWENMPVGQLVTSTLVPVLKKVDAAIAAKNAAAFKESYGALNAACNACHVAAKKPFVVVKTPATDPFSDQNFAGH